MRTPAARAACTEHNHVDLVALRGIDCIEFLNFRLANRLSDGDRTSLKGGAERRRLGRHTQHMEQRDRAEARQRRAEVLELVGIGRAADAGDNRDLPVTIGRTADDAAQPPQSARSRASRVT